MIDDHRPPAGSAGDRAPTPDPLEAELSALAATEPFPPTPDLATRVRERIERDQLRPTGRRWPLALPSFRRSTALALLALLALAGTVLAASIVIGGLRIRFVQELPSIPPVSSVPSGPAMPGERLNLGRRVELDEARVAAGFTVRVPDDPVLGPPEAVYLSGAPEGGMVSLVWGSRPGFPEGPTGVAVLVTEFPAALDEGHFEKLVHSGATVERTRVADMVGYWVSGGDHAFLYVDEAGNVREESMRLVGSTLIWEDDGVVFRIEGASSLEVAQRIASTIR